MITDSKGNSVNFGDYVAVRDMPINEYMRFSGILRIVRLSETPKGVVAVGAYVDLVGNGKVAKMPVDLAHATVVMRSDGSAVA